MQIRCWTEWSPLKPNFALGAVAEPRGTVT